jgi:L,D-transpeptidase ErfK/SrfK
MTRRLLLIFLIILPAAPGYAAKTTPAPPLYVQVVGGEEECVVPPKTTLNRVALERGVKWTMLARENKIPKPYKIKAGMMLKVNTTHIVPMELGHGFVINLPELLLYHFKDGAYQRRYALAVGKPSWQTPTGNYRIRNKTKNPTWTVPESIQEEMAEAGYEVVEKVPPGPKNPLGKFWMGTTAPGVGIHATNRPWSVGYFVSHGCIRMLPEEIEQLFPQVEVGLPVKIIYRPVKMAVTPQGRIYLEVHPDIYAKKIDYPKTVKEMAQKYRLTDYIDWEKIPLMLKTKDGVARDVTLHPIPPKPGTQTAGTEAPKEMGLFPLQGRDAKIE